MKTASEKGIFACGVYIDFKKSFDTVNHELLNKLNYYGIRGTELQWFKMYLKVRKQLTIVSSFSSKNKYILIIESPRDLSWALYCCLFT